MQTSKRDVLDFQPLDDSIYSLGLLLDTLLSTQDDFLPEETAEDADMDADEQTPVVYESISQTSLIPPSFHKLLVIPKDVVNAVERYNMITFAILDVGRHEPPKIPLVNVARHVRPKQRMVFPAAQAMADAGSTSQTSVTARPPTLRVAIATTWSPYFVSQCKLNKPTGSISHDLASDASKVCDLLCFDGVDMWQGAVTMNKLKSDKLSDCVELHRMLTLGTRILNKKKGTADLTRTARFTIPDSSAHRALFQLSVYNGQDLTDLFDDDGVEVFKCGSGAPSVADKMDAVSHLFVHGFKQQIISQHLITSLLFSLSSLEKNALELIGDVNKVVSDIKSKEELQLKNFAALLNTKKRRIAELEQQLSKAPARPYDEQELTPAKNAEDSKQAPKVTATAKARTKAKAKVKAKVKAKAKAQARATSASLPRSEEDESLSPQESPKSPLSHAVTSLDKCKPVEKDPWKSSEDDVNVDLFDWD